ncbi:penicillin acylase family protein [Pseudoalteromonas luteoviolacea]|uniref:Penicillin amidase n=1 Tax=Pseudoalteromonas luteoviolacea S4060-1 TaxID=1365257 RepID=A0A167MEW2_9GAMM|nr:penicillin acylase family protein [Pseudoalteromonas luteoviolacea]KZN66277.1 hypothetical protein N478_20390 [Pseudoalteromonas luteoviolacea S4060-1]
MLMHSHPILSRFIFWVIMPIILTIGIGYFYLSQSLPQKQGVIRLEGLTAPVKVVRDEHAIPHITAETDHDAFFSLGYLHAQDRLWQMNYKRRVAQGRLSEILGIDSLGADQSIRAFGLVRAAETALESLDEPAIKVLERYAAGVNAWIAEGHTLPSEFYIFDTKPEPWTPVDSLLMIKLMSFNLGPNYTIETNFDLLVKQVGLEKANEIVPNVNAKNSKAIDIYAGSEADSGIQMSLLALNEQLQKEHKTAGEVAVGSNAWAVSGEHTESGLPLLAGDPHLFIEMPSIWYLANIKGDRLHVTGATFPGTPLVFMGHNQSVSWGITNMFPDAVDVFVERVNPANQNQYEVDGEWVDMEVEEQLIYIKPDFPSFLTNPIGPIEWQVRRTRNGPLISDAIGRVERPLAIRWTALDNTDKTFQSYLGMNYAQGLDGFTEALKDYKAPAVNIIYADKDNNIASFAAGKLPIRRGGNGRLPVPGWVSDYQWERYIPFDEMPHVINPEEGYVISANNQNHPDDYPYIIANLWSPTYRLERITEVLQGHIDAGHKMTVQDFVTLQGDTESVQVREVLPFIQNLPVTTDEQKDAIEKLKSWDGVIAGDSVATTIYQAWSKHFNHLLLSDDLRGSLLYQHQGDQVQTYITRLKPTLMNQLIHKSPDIKFDWCDRINTENHESCEDLGLIALDDAIDELNRTVSLSKEWGDINEVHFSHPTFGHDSFFSDFYNRSIGGNSDRFSVNRADWMYWEGFGYRVISAAAYRQVIDLSDENKSGFINGTGQSGQVLSEHYDDNIVPFKQLQLRPMHRDQSNQSGSELTLTLEPAK